MRRQAAPGVPAVAVALAWSLALASGAVGCSGGGSGGSASTTPTPTAAPTSTTSPAGLQGEGTPIAGGVLVEPGSRLLGTAFPIWTLPDAEPTTDPERRWWEAIVLVDGDPVEVFDAYVEQLGHLGIAPVVRRAGPISDPARDPVVPGDDPAPDPPPSPCLTAARDDAFGPARDAAGDGASTGPIVCRTSGAVIGADPNRLAVTLSLVTTGAQAGATWASFLVVRVKGGAEGEDHPSTDTSADLLDGLGGGLPPVGPVPAPPAEGDPMAPEDLDPGADLYVVPGIRQLAPAVLDPEAVTGGYLAVFAYEGDPTEVLDRVIRRQEHPGDGDRPRPVLEVDGRPLHVDGWSGAGGASASAWTYPDATGTGYLLVKVGND